ncbi:MAG TPA: SDR family NAD(P)-dependent oxidoreductase [Steroidobacteraceae bacterium]|nr:SDR family NAD(P)-dependent oxidoreductase [Steroidobacteraceae bacterium]
MTQPSDPATLSPVKRALLALEEMQSRLHASERRLREPVAVIGIGCRFPGGANDPDSYWSLLRSGRDAIVEVPPDRWDVDAYYDPNPDAPGKMSTRWGGFIDEVDRFDPQLFGISPREALTMDPQQRLLLEVTWEALERAGQNPERLKGTRTGVFVAIATSDYWHTLLHDVDPSRIDAHFATGISHSIASGRISYCLGLQGVCLSIDTGCSGSLLSIHQACASLRTGESQLAIAAGVNLILRPELAITYSKARMMAPDGRCKAFDARANGFVRGEGCGVVILKRLADAQRDGDPILAIIRGTASNQDGASSGLTAPNGAAQEALIRAALADGELHPDAVGYVEAHGTGTSLGDPIEVRALGNIFGSRARSAALRIGSAKTNFGHLESAAGIAGFIKAVLCLMHGEIPPSLHFQTPNPHIAWEDMSVEVAARLQPFPEYDGRRIAGVSSFGFSGTNVHVVLESASETYSQSQPAHPPRAIQLLTLSAKSEAALDHSVRRLSEYLEGPGRELALADVCHTASAGRAHFAHRLAVPVKSRDELIHALRSIESGTPAGVRGQVSGAALPKIAFLFTGQGAQYPGMGRELYESEPVFRDVLDRCAQAMAGELDRPLLDVMWGADSAQLDQTRYTQPALYALEVALASLWRSWGVEPAAVLGHSVGEYAAACVAGAFTVEEGARLVAARGRLMQALPAGGGMLAVQGERAQPEIERALAGVRDVGVAAYNAPGSIVLSGALEALDRIGERLQSAGLRVQRLQVSHAFHSHLLEPMLGEYERLAGEVRHSAPQTRWLSNLTGEVMDWERWSGNIGRYWRMHAREAVKFEACVRTAVRAGAQLFLEVGPHGVLTALGQATVGGEPLGWAVSLRRGRGALEQLLESVAQVYVRGAPLDWERFAAPYRYRKVSLPTYPFQRERYMVDVTPQRARPTAAGAASETSLLGRRIDSPAFDGAVFATEIGPGTAAEFALDHRVFGLPILPGTAYLTLAVEAASRVLESDSVALRDVEIREALAVPESGKREVQVLARNAGNRELRLEIYSRSDGSSPWILHFVARALVEGAVPQPSATAAEPDDRCPDRLDIAMFYSELAATGLEFGPLFRCVSALRCGARDAVGEAALPQALQAEAAHYRIHPVLLDACVQVLAAVSRRDDPEGMFLPVQIGSCRIERPSTPLLDCRAHATLRAGGERDAQVLAADVRVQDSAGNVVATLEGVRLQRAGCETLDRLRSVDLADSLVELRWEAEEADTAGAWATPTALASRVLPGIARLTAESGWEQWTELASELDNVCRAYIGAALDKIGWRAAPHNGADSAALAARLGIKPSLTRCLDRFVTLRGRGPLTAQPNEQLDTLMKRFPAFAAELTLVKRCGPQLADVLTGRRDPLHLLFPDNDSTTLEQLYRDSPSARLFNGIVREAVKAAVSELPAGRPLRALEIGGGTGSTTAHVIDVLPAERTSYLFTDLSPLFAARAAERFAQRGFLRAQPLDIERDPRSQGIEGHFDLIIAANVLHATRDLGETLRHVRELLAPGGLLIGIEVTRPQDWIDITFGLTDGWWRFTDSALRPDYPLITSEQWKKTLSSTGFDEVALLPETSSESGATDLNTVLLARAGAQSLAQGSASSRWLLLADRGGVAEELARLLRAQGASLCLAYAGESYGRRADGAYELDPLRSADFERLLPDVAADMAGPIDRVVHLWSLDESISAPQSLTALRARTMAMTGSALHLTQAMLKASQSTPPALVVVSRGAVAVGDQPVSPLPATLWGWARSVRLEHPELRCASVDLDPGSVRALAENLRASLLRRDDELQIAWRNGISHVARLARANRVARPANARLAVPTGPHKLATRARGVLDALYLEPITRRVPGAGEVEIRVCATGLNFRDVLAALNMYPGDQGPLGSECAGVVTAVGPDVHDVKVGDEVIAIAPGAFATHVITTAKLVVPKPSTLTAVQAASIPNVFLTAHWALNHLGRMKAGERVLIHAGAGGVGLAAIQLAQRAGAEIFATAGSAEKRAYLQSLGVRHVFNSRTTEFAQAVRERTGGRGVDLVLNCLAGEFIEASLALVAPGGRFLEIGRTGIWTAERVKAAYPGISYHTIDLSQDYAARPDVVRTMLLELLSAMTSGELRVLPIRTFDVSETDAAFRFMAQARHIGKLVVSQPWVAEAGTPVRADRTYWITGGLSGLGLAVARWLVERGARHLLLMGRRPPDEATRKVLDELEAQGARVMVAQADVSDESAVAATYARAREAGLPPFAGVLHAAGALDNAGIQSQSVERYANVFASKIDGAWLLDRVTAREPLDFFVLFSSAASLLGSAGQSNHAAGNAFLDALAHARRAEGKPAISIQWGGWSEVGAAAGEQVASVLRSKGIERMSPARGLQAFEHVLRSAPAVIGVIAADWSRYVEGVPPNARPYFSRLVTAVSPVANRASAQVSAAAPEQNLVDRLAAAPDSKRLSLLQAEVRSSAMKVLGLPATQAIDLRAPLASLGLDSLMAVELRNLLGRAIARPLPATLLFDYPSIAAITEHLAKLLDLVTEVAVTPAPGAIVSEGLLERVEGLSEDELDRLLAERMQAG